MFSEKVWLIDFIHWEMIGLLKVDVKYQNGASRWLKRNIFEGFCWNIMETNIIIILYVLYYIISCYIKHTVYYSKPVWIRFVGCQSTNAKHCGCSMQWIGNEASKIQKGCKRTKKVVHWTNMIHSKNMVLYSTKSCYLARKSKGNHYWCCIKPWCFSGSSPVLWGD